MGNRIIDYWTKVVSSVFFGVSALLAQGSSALQRIFSVYCFFAEVSISKKVVDTHIYFCYVFIEDD